MISSLSNSPMPPSKDSPFKHKMSQRMSSKSGSTWALNSDGETPYGTRSNSPVRSDSRGPSATPPPVFSRRGRDPAASPSLSPIKRTSRSRSGSRNRSASRNSSLDSGDHELHGVPIITESIDDEDASINGEDFDEISFRYSPNPSMRSITPCGSKESIKSLSEQNLSAKQEHSEGSPAVYIRHTAHREDEEFSELTFDDRSGFYSHGTSSYAKRPPRSSSPIPRSGVRHRSSSAAVVAVHHTAGKGRSDADSVGSSNHSQSRYDHGLITQYDEVMEVLEGITEGGDTQNSSSQQSTFLKHAYPDCVTEVDFKKHKDIPLTLSMTEKRGAEFCLSKEEANQLKDMSVKNAKILVGWQIQLLKPDGSNIGVGVVTDTQKDLLSRKTLYRVSTLEQGDYWVKLRKSDDKKGASFRPLRQVFRKERQSMVEIPSS